MKEEIMRKLSLLLLVIFTISANFGLVNNI